MGRGAGRAIAVTDCRQLFAAGQSTAIASIGAAQNRKKV
jgi:hypothetical protein